MRVQKHGEKLFAWAHARTVLTYVVCSEHKTVGCVMYKTIFVINIIIYTFLQHSNVS